jgi:hypothetical protein
MEIEDLINRSKALLDSLLTEEALAMMTDEQLNLIEEAKKSVNLDGDLGEKLEILKKYTDVNKHK